MKNLYYEIHITLEARGQKLAKAAELANMYGLSFAIVDKEDDDGHEPIATRRLSAELTPQDASDWMDSVVRDFRTRGIPVLRYKLESTLVDSKRQTA